MGFAAALMTAIVTIGITIYAWTTKTDFTGQGCCFFVIAFAFLGFGICCIFTSNPMMRNLYSLFGVIIYGFYLIYHTQLLVGGDRSMQYSEDDYIVAAIQIYLDII